MVLAVTAVTIGVLGIDGVLGATQEPVLAMLGAINAVPILVSIVTMGIVITLLGNASGNTISLPRLLLAMSRDKLFIEQFSDIHPKKQTPYKAIVLQTLVTITIIIIALTVPGAKGIPMHEMLLSLLVPVSLIMYTAIIILVPYFRWRRPQHPRPFKAPLGRFLPVLVSMFFLGLLIFWSMNDPNAITQLRLLFSFIFFCIPIYLLLTYFYDPDSLISTLSFFSKVNLWLEKIIVPKRIRQEVIDMFHNSKGKHVLEFGSGVGTITIHIAEEVGKDGKVYAVGLSQADVDILQKRMTKNGHLHVEVIHDPHLINRVHPQVQYVDMIVSINHLGYIQDVKKVLREMHSILPKRGHIYFVEYIDLFYFLPNPKWLSNPETVKQVFNEAGFTVNVKIKRGLFWKYLYIYGVKESNNVPYI
jgi:ubiquinone/menaquinone biosynthesis C-methylase UbiE